MALPPTFMPLLRLAVCELATVSPELVPVLVEVPALSVLVRDVPPLTWLLEPPPTVLLRLVLPPLASVWLKESVSTWLCAVLLETPSLTLVPCEMLPPVVLEWLTV